MLQVACPYCRTPLQVPPALVGKMARCPTCRKPMSLAGAAAAAQPKPTPPIPAAAPRPKSVPPARSSRKEPETDFTPTAPRRPAPQPSRRSKADAALRRRPRDIEEKPATNLGLWIGLGVGGGALALGAVALVAILAIRSDSRPAEVPPQVAVADVQALVPPVDLGAIAKVEAPKPDDPRVPAVAPDLAPIAVAPPPPAGPLPAQIDGADIRRVKKATAFLRVTAADGVKMTGSGFFAIEPGIVFTNAHVIDMLDPNSPAPRAVEIVLNSGEADEKALQGKILGVDRDHDLAIVKASGTPGDWPALLAVDFADNLTELQDVYVFGFPFGANLGKNITVSKSSVSSLRKDDSGHLHEVQVNGGMNPGNSGGPVVDSRGVVVGVAVAIIRGTQINFAIPSERVMELAVGRVLESRLQDPYKAGDAIRAPFEVACLDPLQRVRKVDAEIWTGPAGPNRAGGVKAPNPVAGDGPHRRVPMAYTAGKAVADLTLPTAPPGSVVWVQPILSDAAGKAHWGTARSASLADLPPLDRQPATLHYDFAKVPERTVVLKNHVRVEVKKRDLVTEDLDAKILEIAKVGNDGGQTELWIGNLTRVADIDGKRRTADPKIVARVNASAFGWVFHPEGRSKSRSNATLGPKLAPSVRIEMEDLINSICNGLESTFVPVAPGEMKPGGTWPARVPMMFVTQGKAEVADLQLTCSYEGTRTVDNATMAFVRATGMIVPRKAKDSSFLRGKVDGRIHYDLASGYIGQAKMRLTSDIALLTGSVATLIIETDLKRTPGNTFNIVVPARAEPTPKATPTPPTPTAKTPKSPAPTDGSVSLGDLVFEDTKLSAKDVLPCMLWAADGKSFYTVEMSGVVRRIGGTDLVEQQKAELGAVCSWMTMSAEGLVVAVAGAQEIAILDPDTLQTKKKIGVPSVDRITSSPKLSVAFAVSKGNDALVSAVDLKAGRIAKQFDNNELGRVGALRFPIVSPDGKYLFAQSGIEQLHRFRIDGTNLTHEQGSPRIAANGQTVEVSPDSKLVCLPSGGGNGPGYVTNIYAVENLKTPAVVIKGGAYPRAMGFNPKQGLILSQSHDKQLIVFDNAGIRLKDFSIPRERETRKIVASPESGLVLILTDTRLYRVKAKQ